MEFRLVAFFPHSVERENIVRGDQKTCEKDLWLAMELLIRPSRTKYNIFRRNQISVLGMLRLSRHIYITFITHQQSISDKLWPEFRYVLGYFRTFFIWNFRLISLRDQHHLAIIGTRNDSLLDTIKIHDDYIRRMELPSRPQMNPTANTFSPLHGHLSVFNAWCYAWEILICPMYAKREGKVEQALEWNFTPDLWFVYCEKCFPCCVCTPKSFLVFDGSIL